jgi:hypothetical protein
VTVTFSATDGGSGLADCDEPETLDAEGAGQSATGSCRDVAGNSASATRSGIKIDTTAPTVGDVTPSRPPDSGAWYTSAVTFSATGSDGGGSGNVTCEPEAYDGPDSGEATVTITCADAAGNTASKTSTFLYDATKPVVTITPDRSPDAGTDGYDQAVTFTTDATDGGSGVASCDPPEVYDGPASATASVTMQCTDNAGHVGSATFEFRYVDSSPPVITYTLDPPAVPVGGWYQGDVTLTWHVVEEESPDSLVKQGCEDQVVTTDRPYTTYSCDATSAGGSPSPVEVSFGRDATKPAITFTRTAANPNGWNNTDVTVTFTCTDVQSGVAGSPALGSVVVSTEGADQSATSPGTCADVAGNVAEPITVPGINIDKTAPTAALSVVAGEPGANGWHTSDVTVRTTGTDALSGGLVCTSDQTLSAETAGQTVTGSCTDRAGNTTDAAALTVKLDKSGPTATLEVVSGTLGTNDWYTSDVTVRTSGAEEVSQPATCTADQTLSVDTAARVFEGSCTNEAGLTTAAQTLTVKMDKTSPALAPSLSLDEVALHSTVTAAANATDGGSGVASSSCGAIDTSTAGARSVTCTATDAAGNTATATLEYEVVLVEGTIAFGTPPPPGGGFGTFSFGGGSFGQLVAASECPVATSVFFHNKASGAFAVWIPGTQVAIVNAEMLAMFPNGLPEGIIFTAKCV